MSNFNEQSFGVNYCINPECDRRQNPDNLKHCQSCGTSLFVNDRYRLIEPLRDLDRLGNAEVFEVEDWGVGEEDWQIPKVLKINRSSEVRLFEREARVLMTLRHSGIPRVSVKGYFSVFYGKRFKQLHCLVMEKIEGQNLEKWLEENGKVSEDIAIIWLEQLAIILGKIHHKELLHRDIKPSNIMLRRDGQLALIDFGTVGEIAPVDSDRLSERNVTIVFSGGYTAPEQYQGQAVPQSDFFALGRTFVHLLTDKYPSDLPTDAKGKLIWRDNAANVSKWLVELIDDLMATIPKNRPQNTKVILERLKSRQTKPKVRFRWRDLPKILLTSVLVTSAVMGIRWFGVLQPSELQAYDRLMRSRPPDLSDYRILVVEITQDDINKDGGYPLKHSTLAKVIKNLYTSKPAAIGLDLHRYQRQVRGVNDLTDRQEFIKLFQHNENLFLVCASKKRNIDYQPPGEFSEKELENKVGFSDVVPDEQQDSPIRTVRRQWLSYNSRSVTSRCKTPYSLSLQLAKKFLLKEGKDLSLTENYEWHYEKIIFKVLPTRTGGYQTLDGQSDQILLNYRSPGYLDANKVTLAQVLSGQVDPNLVKNRVVLIGYAIGTSARDEFNTPYGEMAGVWIHAHMTSQILSVVLDGRPLLWVLPQWRDFQWGDAVFVWLWSLTGGLLICGFRSILHLSLLSGAAIWLLYKICLIIIIQGGWMPLIPSALSLVTTGVILAIYIAYRNQQQQ